MAPTTALSKRVPIHLPKIYNTYFVAVIATVGGMLFGFDISSINAIIGTDQYIDYFNNPHGTLQGAIGSALAAGSVLGAICAGPLSDWQGRRDAIWYACIFWVIGTGVQVGCTSPGMLIAGRFINGICVGVSPSHWLLTIRHLDVRMCQAF
jgi:MFS family permease